MNINAVSGPTYIYGSCEIIIHDRLVSAAENNKNGYSGTMYWGDSRADCGLECYLDGTG